MLRVFVMENDGANINSSQSYKDHALSSIIHTCDFAAWVCLIDRIIPDN
jgi:hypothetical protein